MMKDTTLAYFNTKEKRDAWMRSLSDEDISRILGVNESANVVETVDIDGTTLPVKMWNGKMVMTFNEIDNVHKQKEGHARNRFSHNKKYFHEGEDYFLITPKTLENSEMSLKETFGNLIKSPRGMTFLTESGYLMLVKTFRDKRAWEVQRKLVDGYFRLKDIQQKNRSMEVVNEARNNWVADTDYLQMLREDREKYLTIIADDRKAYMDVISRQMQQITDLVGMVSKLLPTTPLPTPEPELTPKERMEAVRDAIAADKDKNNAQIWRKNINDLCSELEDETGRDRNSILSDAYNTMRVQRGIPLSDYQFEYHKLIGGEKKPSTFNTVCWVETEKDKKLNGTLERVLWDMLEEVAA